MSVESGLGAAVDRPVEEPSSPPTVRSRRPLTGRARSRRGARGAQRADALADAISTPAFRVIGRGRPRRRGRRVKRVVRRIELWSVLKVSLVFNTVMLGVALGSVAVLWGLANTTGLIDDLEGFLRDSGFEDFRFEGERMFRQVAFLGAVAALAFTVFTVLATALVNLISEITGGIRFVVIEEITDEDDDEDDDEDEDDDGPAGPPRGAPAPAVPSVPPPTAPPRWGPRS